MPCVFVHRHLRHQLLFLASFPIAFSCESPNTSRSLILSILCLLFFKATGFTGPPGCFPYFPYLLSFQAPWINDFFIQTPGLIIISQFCEMLSIPNQKSIIFITTQNPNSIKQNHLHDLPLKSQNFLLSKSQISVKYKGNDRLGYPVTHFHRGQSDHFSKSWVFSSKAVNLFHLLQPIPISCLDLPHFYVYCIALSEALIVVCLKHCSDLFYRIVSTLPSELLLDASQKLSIALITTQQNSLTIWPQASSYFWCQ